jgi:hypothetical protein
MRLLALPSAIAFALVVWLQPAGAAVPNANSIACPSAPAGWSTPTGGGARSVRSPNPGDATPADLDPGSDQVTLTCGYLSTDGKKRLFSVIVNYAVPYDFNPYSDFYVGCVTKLGVGLPNGDLAWNKKVRRYRILSLNAWTYAGFYDLYHTLAESEVKRFKGVAQALLRRSVPAAHNCELPGKGGAAQVPKTWSFMVYANLTADGVTIQTNGGGGGFTTTVDTKGAIAGVDDLSGKDLLLLIGSPQAPPQRVTVRYGKALSFKTTPVKTLTLSVEVVDSGYGGCEVGSTGTLTISNAPSVTLELCGRTLLQGSTAVGQAGAGGVYVKIA